MNKHFKQFQTKSNQNLLLDRNCSLSISSTPLFIHSFVNLFFCPFIHSFHLLDRTCLSIPVSLVVLLTSAHWVGHWNPAINWDRQTDRQSGRQRQTDRQTDRLVIATPDWFCCQHPPPPSHPGPTFTGWKSAVVFIALPVQSDSAAQQQPPAAVPHCQISLLCLSRTSWRLSAPPTPPPLITPVLTAEDKAPPPPSFLAYS